MGIEYLVDSLPSTVHLCRFKGIMLHVPVDLLMYNKVIQMYDNGQWQAGQFLCGETSIMNTYLTEQLIIVTC